ncbi:MAG: TonB-dependent receptor [Myxococcales bacterium]|nr:TonB-dependent receptor [Myxococcales bacterium]
MRGKLGVLLAGSLAASVALADNTADEADIAFRLGNEDYSKRDYDGALSHYFLSYRLVANQNVLFNIARCFEALDRFDEAYRYYNDLSSMSLEGEDRREVSQALARIRPKVALLKVVTEPPGADVFVDREDLGSRGRSPQALALPPGRHKVVVRLSGHHSAEAFAVLSKGRETVQRFALPLVVGKVDFTGAPEGAAIREGAEGPVLGKVPASLSFPPGKRLFHVGAEGFLPSQHLVEVKAEGTVELPVKLEARPPASGKVIVTANRESALVKVDGREAGFTPTVLLLPVGEHTLEVSMKELRPVSRQLVVEADSEQKIYAELRYAPPEVQAASKSVSSADEAPASITVISSEELRAFGFHTLAEALSSVRGLFVTDDRVYTRLGIRGFSPPGDYNTRVLILWDGHSMNDIWAGQGYAGRDLSADLDEVERIEVVRGPGSALYGTGAFFAVINVVPRQHLFGKNGEARAGAGALSSFRGHLAGGPSGERMGALFSAGAYRAAGAENTDLLGLGRAYGLDQERAYSGTARAKLGGLTLFAQVNHREKEIPTAPFGTVLGASGTSVQDQRGFAEARYEAFLGSHALTLRGYYDASRYVGGWVYPGESEEDPPVRHTDSGQADWVGSEARLRLRLSPSNHLTAGVESQLHLRVDQQVFGGADAGPLETRRRTLVSAYLLDEWRLHPRLLISAGLRLDKVLDLAELPITPRLGVVARPYERGLTKLVAGTAFRAPNVYELYYGDNNVTQRPALRLSPETIATFELEHAHELSDELTVAVAGYHNRIQGLVVLLPDPSGELSCGATENTEVCQVNQNASGVIGVYGAEAEVRWQAGRFAMMDASYSFVRIVADETGSFPAPAHLFGARLLMPIGESGMRVAVQANYQSRQVPLGEDPWESSTEALILSLALSGDAGPLRYHASVRNLLDARWAIPTVEEGEQRLIPQYGRAFSLELSARF